MNKLIGGAAMRTHCQKRKGPYVFRTRQRILTLFKSHVDTLNHIFGDTNFQGIRGINFLIARTTIFDNNSCYSRDSKFHNPFCKETTNILEVLETNSKRNHSDFCLVYAFTHRDFKNGSLGLAYGPGNGLGNYGGLCDPYKQFFSPESGRVWRSSNTGVITLSSNGNTVSPITSQLAFAHEVGHSFGATHDLSLRCRPGPPMGNYLMSASSNPGHLPNHARFSSCSIANISQLLFSVMEKSPRNCQDRLEDGKGNCFIERQSSLCGNQIVEEGEECDCGHSNSDCYDISKDSCCYPAEHAKGCTLKPPAACSPSQGICCDASSCSVYPESKSCASESECSFESSCDGRTPQCPAPEKKQDRTPCRQNTKLCVNGHCDVSVCATAGYRQCQITSESQLTKCQLGCLVGGNCVSSFEISQLQSYYQEKAGNLGILLPRNSPCENFEGKCDLRGRCRKN